MNQQDMSTDGEDSRDGWGDDEPCGLWKRERSVCVREKREKREREDGRK